MAVVEEGEELQMGVGAENEQSSNTSRRIYSEVKY